MKEAIGAWLVACVIWPGSVAAQKPRPTFSANEIIAQIQASGLDPQTGKVVRELLTQRHGPVSRNELDALADQLVAAIVARPPLGTEPHSANATGTASNALSALGRSAHPEHEQEVPYQGAYDAVLRAVVAIREAGKSASREIATLVEIDGERALGFVEELLQSLDKDGCDPARTLHRVDPELRADLDSRLRPRYLQSMCGLHKKTSYVISWPWIPGAQDHDSPTPIVGFGLIYREGWQAHRVADRPYPVVRTIERCSPAHYAGLRQGDTLLTVNGHDAREYIPATDEFGEPGDQTAVQIERGEAGTEYVLTADRDGSVIEFTVNSIDRLWWAWLERPVEPYPITGWQTPTHEGCWAVPPWEGR